MTVGLREGHESFDFAVLFILREAEELLSHKPLDIDALPAFTHRTVDQLKEHVGKGDQFYLSVTRKAKVRCLGSYRVDGAIMSVSGYNDISVPPLRAASRKA